MTNDGNTCPPRRTLHSACCCCCWKERGKERKRGDGYVCSQPRARSFLEPGDDVLSVCALADDGDVSLQLFHDLLNLDVVGEVYGFLHGVVGVLVPDHRHEVLVGGAVAGNDSIDDRYRRGPIAVLCARLIMSEIEVRDRCIVRTFKVENVMQISFLILIFISTIRSCLCLYYYPY